MSLADCRIINLRRIQDERGCLTVVEGDDSLPFSIQRAYWLHDVPSGESRAGHAHKTLMQLIVAVSGSCDVTLDDGVDRQTWHLDSPSVGLYIHPMTWREVDHFSRGVTLVVLASANYMESDYFRDYDAFIRAAP